MDSNTQKAIRALLSPYPALEAAAMAVLTQRTVDNAVGAQLDVIGGWVGRPRSGVTDDEIYRRYVRAQIVANKSSGTIEDALAVADLVIHDGAATLTIRNEGAAAYVLEVSTIALPDAIAAVLVRLLIKATSAGVRIILERSSSPPSTVLRWSTHGVWGTAVLSNGTDREI